MDGGCATKSDEADGIYCVASDWCSCSEASESGCDESLGVHHDEGVSVLLFKTNVLI